MSFPSVFRIKKKKTAELQVPYKVVSLSDAQQSESVTHTRPLCCRSPSRPGHPGAPGRAAWLRGGSSSLAYFAVRQCQTPDSSHPLLPHGNQKFVPYVRDYFCFAGKFTCTNSLGSTYKQHCMVFLSDILHCVSQSAGPSTSLRMALFHPFYGWVTPTVYAYHFLIPSSANRYLGCSHVPGTVNNVASIHPFKW